MKSRHLAVLALLVTTLNPAAHAEASLPESGDKEGWQNLAHLFAECSAVYNLAANLAQAPQKGPAPYRELANSALVAGIFSSERAGLSDTYIESIYSVKYGLWQESLREKAKHAALLGRAEQCINETNAYQNQLVGTARTPTAAK